MDEWRLVLRGAWGSARLFAVVATALAILLVGQAAAWAAPAGHAAAQTIPTVTAAAAGGTPVVVPDGLDAPNAATEAASQDLWLLSAIPWGCLCLGLGLAVLAIGGIAWRWGSRRKA